MIPDSVTSIGSYVFDGCTSLTSVTIPDSVTSIGYSAFSGCLLEYVKMGAGLTFIPSSLIQEDTLKEFIIGDSVTRISDSAFNGCTSLTSVTIPDSVTSIGWGAFRDCSGLTSVTIPDSVTSIGWGAFSGCTSLTSVTIPDSVTTIGDEAFHGCTGLTSVTIPDSVTSIGYSAFSGCTGLTSVTIPESVTSIGRGAFSSCRNLKTVCYGGTNQSDIMIEQYNSELQKAQWYYHEHNKDTGTETRNAVTPTCKSEGYSGDVYYMPCGVLKQAGEKLPVDPNAHAFGAWTLTTAPTIYAEGVETQTCAICGAKITRSIPKLPMSKVAIHDFTSSSKTYAYRSSITFAATVENPTPNGQIHWFVDGKDVHTGEVYTAENVRHSFFLQAKYFDDGKEIPQAATEIEKVNVNTGFFARLIAFFRGLFGLLPKEAQAYLGLDRVFS